MSFVLPGNQRQLRFTGEAQAFTPKSDPPGANGAIALGKPRVRRSTQPPVPAPPPPSITPASPQMPMPSARAQRNRTTPPAGRLNTPIPAPRISERDFDDDHEDQQQTMALDRDRDIDVMPVRPSSRPGPNGGPPIPHFRPAGAAVATVLAPGQQQDTKKGAPLALWLFAAVLAGVLSYFVTPMAMSHFESPPPKVATDMH